MNFTIENYQVYSLFNTISTISLILLIIAIVLLVISVKKNKDRKVISKFCIITLLSFIPRILYTILQAPNALEYVIRLHEIILIIIELIIRIIMIIYTVRHIRK